jgi:hypothetical protein
LNCESGGCETGAFKKKKKEKKRKKKKKNSTGNSFEVKDFYPDELWNTQISSGLIHLGLDIISFYMFRLFVRCKLVAVWWMANKRAFASLLRLIILLHWGNRLTYQCPRSWPVVITMKKKLASTWKQKYRILAGPNEWQTSLQPVKSWKNR